MHVGLEHARYTAAQQDVIDRIHVFLEEPDTNMLYIIDYRCSTLIPARTEYAFVLENDDDDLTLHAIHIPAAIKRVMFCQGTTTALVHATSVWQRNLFLLSATRRMAKQLFDQWVEASGVLQDTQVLMEDTRGMLRVSRGDITQRISAHSTGDLSTMRGCEYDLVVVDALLYDHLERITFLTMSPLDRPDTKIVCVIELPHRLDLACDDPQQLNPAEVIEKLRRLPHTSIINPFTAALEGARQQHRV